MSWFDPNDGIPVEDCEPVKDVMAFDEKLKDGKLYRENPILVPEGYYDTAVRVAKENNIAVKIEPVKAVWKTDEK